jgi:Ser/Thr protein kinase RdoA (MazF antagonist)
MFLKMENSDDLKVKIEKILDKQITEFSLKGQGDCNYAYYFETTDGSKYIAKVEREQKQTQDQNDLIVESNIISQLYDAKPSVPVPHVVAASENPKLYIYEYIEGELMRGVWGALSEEEKIDIGRSLGQFHAEIGQKLTKEMCAISGVEISEATGLRPKVIEEEYDRLILEPDVPNTFKDLVKEAKRIFDGTTGKLIFQFIHNDGHPENILIKDKKIVGVIDFGDAEYGDVAKEFSRYVRDIPDYFKYIISSYEEVSGNKLSLERVVSNALISGFPEIVEDYRKGGEDRARAEKTVETYKRLLII